MTASRLHSHSDDAAVRFLDAERRRAKQASRRKITHPWTYDLAPPKSRYEQIKYRYLDYAGLSERAGKDIARLNAQLDSIYLRIEKAERRRNRYTEKWNRAEALLANLDAQIDAIKKPTPIRRDSNHGN